MSPIRQKSQKRITPAIRPNAKRDGQAVRQMREAACMVQCPPQIRRHSSRYRFTYCGGSDSAYRCTLRYRSGDPR